MNNAGNAGEGAILLEQDPTALDPKCGEFLSAPAGTFPGDNEPTSPRTPTPYGISGYNIDGTDFAR